MHYTLSAFLLTLVLSKAHAGPFGLSAGMSLAEVRKLGFVKPDGPYTYTVERLTTGYREFTSYGLLLTPQLGLCRVIASTEAIQDDPYGTEVRKTFDRLHSLLTPTYRAGTRLDYLKKDARFTAANEWLRSLVEGERQLSAVWTAKDDELPDKIKGILLQTKGVDERNAMIFLRYDFSNFTQCAQQRQARDAVKF